MHVFERTSSLLDDNQMIRDYVRAHPEAGRRYVAVKERALEQGHDDLLSYSQAKGPHVAAVREAAYHWTRLRRRDARS